jgi:hypothetical protein
MMTMHRDVRELRYVVLGTNGRALATTRTLLDAEREHHRLRKEGIELDPMIVRRWTTGTEINNTDGGS